MSLITLYEWGQRLPVPRSMETLRRWVRAGKVYPAPAFDGYQYLVEEKAVKLASACTVQQYVRQSGDSLTTRINNGRTEKKS